MLWTRDTETTTMTLDRRLTLVFFVLTSRLSANIAQQVNFAGRTWFVKNGDNMGPGPNAWRAENVGVNGGGLRLTIAQRGGVWSCAEVWLDTSLGFGRYEFEVSPPSTALRATS